jgi:MFS family permease
MPKGRTVWRERDFVLLWSATTASMLGSFVTRTALPFAAILVLGAGASEVAALRSAELVAGILLGLVAGAWVDRLRRRPVMIWADLGRALLLASVPIAFVLGLLTLVQLVIVAFGTAVLTTFFDVADRAFLPTVVGRERLVEANATLTASSSAAEFVGFGAGGWLIQLLTAPVAIALDTASFVLSALLIHGIRRREATPSARVERSTVVSEIGDGLRRTLRDPILRPLALADATVGIFWGIYGAVFLVFATELGFEPGVIGLLAAFGGLSSVGGAVVAARAVRRFGAGRFLVLAMLVAAIGNTSLPFAPDAALLGLLCLLFQQLVHDGAITAWDVVAVSIRQTTVEDRLLGRVGASMHMLALAFQLGGTLLGAVVAEVFGLRAAVAVAAIGGFAAPVIIWFSAARRLQTVPIAGVGTAPVRDETPDVPRTE